MNVTVVVEVVGGTISPIIDSTLRSLANHAAFLLMSLFEISCSMSGNDLSSRFARASGSADDGTVILQTAFTMPSSRRPSPTAFRITGAIFKLTCARLPPSPAASTTASLSATSATELVEKATGSSTARTMSQAPVAATSVRVVLVDVDVVVVVVVVVEVVVVVVVLVVDVVVVVTVVVFVVVVVLVVVEFVVVVFVVSV